ncbi:hypothetical protein QTP88_018852 [Uroleucon formosanum]
MSPTTSSAEKIEEKPITLLSQEKEEDCRLLNQSVLRLTVYWLRLRDRLRKNRSYQYDFPFGLKTTKK